MLTQDKITLSFLGSSLTCKLSGNKQIGGC